MIFIFILNIIIHIVIIFFINLPVGWLSPKKVPIHEAGHVLWYVKIISKGNNSNNRRESNLLLSVYCGHKGGAMVYKGEFIERANTIKILVSGIAAVRLYDGAKPIGIGGVLLEKWFLGGYSDIKRLQNLGLSLREIASYINICMESFSEYDKKFMEVIRETLSIQPNLKNKYSGYTCQSIPKETLYKLSRQYYKKWKF